MGGVIGEKVGMGRDGPELDPLRVQTQLRACHRLRSQWKCGFIGLYFVDLQGSFVSGANKILLLLWI